MSPSGSRTSHETRNSVVFTPATHSKNSSNLSTDSNTPEQCRQSKSPRPEKQQIRLPDNYVNQLNWNNNNDDYSFTQSTDEFHSDTISTHHIGMVCVYNILFIDYS